MSKIIAFTSKYNVHCVETVICDDDKVDEEIKKRNNYNYVVNNWFG